MSQFLKKIEEFKENQFSQVREHYKSLQDGQKPHTLLITCSDSRICPQEISQSQAGELFVIRNAGNLMSRYSADNPSFEALTLEYAVSVLQVPEIVVCGHVSCGAMGALKDLDKVKSLHLLHKGLKNYKDQYQNEIAGKSSDELIAWNVQTQLRHLFSYPFVKEAMAAGSLRVYGMVYDFVNAQAEALCEMNDKGELLQ